MVGGTGPVLYLTGLTASVEDPLTLLFDRRDGTVAATWFSGMLRGTLGPHKLKRS